MTEGHIHIIVRRELKKLGWRLIAGQYPGGSDDELHSLSIVDPIVARDDSPDPRRHSENKLIPDLIALKNNSLLIIEMKPDYSESDRNKLNELINERLDNLFDALRKFALERNFQCISQPETLNIIPTLAFSSKSNYCHDLSFLYILVDSLKSIRFVNESIVNWD